MAQLGLQRVRIRVRGTVQGVGFRPFVYRHACERGLSGWVGNDGADVVIEAEGPAAAVNPLVEVIRDEPPPLAIVEAVEVVAVEATGGSGFVIASSTGAAGTDLRVGADVAPCAACLAEMADPADRRFGYPFINCTDCGPRYTIVRAVPYDRASTTMAGFRMCAACQAEYDDPADRRFHAQPNACPACGPALAWTVSAASATGPAALAAAVRCLKRGGIVAVKGVGGYHLACDAGEASTVLTLRQRKRRDEKPFAVMVADLGSADRLCELEPADRELLASARRPIVLAPRRAGAPIASGVAPGLSELGVMLPSSPLHVLLLAGVERPLVMTSGNLSDEPIAHEDADARHRLDPLVDGMLSHDRGIHVRTDDSVVRTRSGRAQVIRRARGWVPQPLVLPVECPVPVLAVGAQLKNTIALAHGRSVVLSHHLGDLEHWSTYVAFTSAVEHLTRLSGIVPGLIAHDLHPDYRATAWAQESDVPLLGVQHHHAHIAACLAEHGVTSKVLGIAFDGLGLGTDGTLWGGEFLLADLTGFARVGHLMPVPLPGGDAATREPWRMALSWLHEALGPQAATQYGPRVDERWPGVLSLVTSGRSPLTSSVGRLFDAVAALVGVRSQVSYEGQAAIELEAAARAAPGRDRSCPPMVVDGAVLDPRPTVEGLVAGRERGMDAGDLAAQFHRALATGAADLACTLASTNGVDTVACSGGVFQNALLTDLLAERLRGSGLRVLLHEQLPPNDGSISAGQTCVAAARLH